MNVQQRAGRIPRMEKKILPPNLVGMNSLQKGGGQGGQVFLISPSKVCLQAHDINTAVKAVDLQNKHLQELFETVSEAESSGWIEPDVAKWLVPDAPAPGRLYGLVKYHAAKEKWSHGGRLPSPSRISLRDYF